QVGALWGPHGEDECTARGRLSESRPCRPRSGVFTVNAAVETDSAPRAELARWAICFAVVATAHGLGAMALLNKSSEASDFGVDVPVVMLELPESLITPEVQAPDLPPGPVEERESEKTPPKEETKPPEPEAEVALAMPEPPKPEPPAEEKQATAP